MKHWLIRLTVYLVPWHIFWPLKSFQVNRHALHYSLGFIGSVSLNLIASPAGSCTDGRSVKRNYGIFSPYGTCGYNVVHFWFSSVPAQDISSV